MDYNSLTEVSLLAHYRESGKKEKKDHIKK